MECPYKNMCRKYPDCPSDCKNCDLFNNFMQREAEKEMRPVKWKPGARE